MHIATKQEVAQTRAGSDGVTVGSIGLLAYMLGNMLHEGAGHGGACLLSGGQPLVLSSVHFECSVDSRVVMAGGTLANFSSGALFFFLGRIASRDHPRLKYFCWIMMTVNLFTATGYFLFSGVGGFGDWAEFIRGLSPQWIWRVSLAIFGAVTYFLAARLSLLELRPLIGSNPVQRYERAVRLSAIPYFAGGILMCLAGALNPRGMILILVSAAASTFGGTSGLLWDTNWLRRGEMISFGPSGEPMPIERSWPLIVAVCIVTVAFVVILGPSVRFGH
ncbi:MAG TPA: hypothetical protein VGU90_09100 [Terriglobales bacterium]|nr:hypothetical protein [Terriglobales bacterium]